MVMQEVGTTRVPPHNLEAEESLLGAMLLSRDAIADALEFTAAEHFYRPAHAHVFASIAALYGNGDPVDPLTVAEELDRSGVGDSIGGFDGLLRLQVNTPATSNAAKYAQIISERHTLRRLIEVAGEITEIGYSVPNDVAGAVDVAENMVFQVAQGRVDDTLLDAKQLLDITVDRLEHLYERGESIIGTPTGFYDLDAQLSGLQPSSFVVVGARPGVGKTAFALNIAAHVSAYQKAPTLVFSLEMGHLELMQRMLCSEARVDAKNMRNGKLSEVDWTRINKGIGRLASGPLYIDDNPNLTIMEIRAKARRLQSRVGHLGLIVVDYLQLMTGRSHAENRQVEVAEISRGLKILARELKCPVLGLSQLSRNLESRQDKRPMLSDLRESGSIEQDADVVLFLYRDEVHNPESEKQGIAEVIIAKHRNGPTGMIQLGFEPRFTAFRNFRADGGV